MIIKTKKQEKPTPQGGKSTTHFAASGTEGEHIPDQGGHEPELRDLPFTLWNLPRLTLLCLIRLYQAVISPALPPDTCRFYPTCSQYGYQSVYKYGVLKGGWLAVLRVIRCNPFNSGGFDPIP